MPVALSWLWCARQKPRRTLWSRSCVDRHYWHYNTQNYYYYYYYVIFLRGKSRELACVRVRAGWDNFAVSWALERTGRDPCARELRETFCRTAASEMDLHWREAAGGRHVRSCTLLWDQWYRDQWKTNMKRKCTQSNMLKGAWRNEEKTVVLQRALKDHCEYRVCPCVYHQPRWTPKGFKCGAHSCLRFKSSAD